MGKSQKTRENSSKSKLKRQKEDEKRAETEITRYSKNSKSGKSNDTPVRIDEIFHVEYDLPTNKFSFMEKFKFKILLSTAPEYRGNIGNRFYFYKLYCVNHQSQRFILDYGRKKLKKGLKLSQIVQFSEKYPPSPLIHFELEIYQDNNLIRTFPSEEIIVDMSGAEKKIKIHEISFYSNVLIPENPFVFWVHASSFPLPDALSLTVNFKLLDHRLLLTEKSFSLKIGGPEAEPENILKFPFQITMPAMENKDKRLKIKIEIFDAKDKHLLFSKKDLIPMEISLTGLRIEHVGYKREVPLGEIAYMLGDIVNKSPYPIKGKAQFYFHTISGDKVLCFDRKFKIPENQYEKISEDVPLLEFLGGKQYWVHCMIKMRANGISYTLESISEPQLAKIKKQPTFFAKLRANLPREPLKVNQIIPIGIDTRIRAENEFNPVYCEVYENYENLKARRLYRFKIKDFSADRSKFHWKIPANYGKYVLQVRFWYKYTLIERSNVESNQLEFELFPL